MSEINLAFEGIDPIDLYGEKNSKINILKKAYPQLTIVSRGNYMRIEGDKKDAQKAKANIEMMVRTLKQNHNLTNHTVLDIIAGQNPFDVKPEKGNNKNVIVYGRNGNIILAKTKNQKRLIQSSETNDIVFAIGPAGTGKTYTAVALAVRALKNKTVKRIILTRPAVEAGENLGFLPGGLKDKIDPYLRPLYDALDDMFSFEKLKFFTDSRTIEIAPLAFMRGRTLDNAFIILDEAQNATSMQLKMFLTRIGATSKCIITGDLTQIDLPRNQRSGLPHSLDLLRDIEGIGVIRMTADDVIRHRLVKDIIKAYAKEREKHPDEIDNHNN